MPSAKQSLTPKKLALRALRELDGFKPRRLDLEWDLPDSQLTDDFFQHHYANIVSNVKLHVDDMFGADSIPSQGSVWSLDTGDSDLNLEFIVGKVARPDPLDPNPWDDLMACKSKRLAVMRAVILNIFSQQLFALQLFGADDKQRRTLLRQDEQFIGHEGERPFRI